MWRCIERRAIGLRTTRCRECSCRVRIRDRLTQRERPRHPDLRRRLQRSDRRRGRHAIHVHEKGHCDPPAFASSGSHWNPEGRKHGTDNPLGAHEGDWDNLDIGVDGRGSSNRLIPRWHGKIPESGLSLVIHAGKDDELTDPDGKSGARIACAVVIPPS